MNRRLTAIPTVALAIALTSACSQERQDGEGIAPGEVKKWNDPNFELIGVGAYNYTDHDIYDVFILPADKNDIAFAAAGSGGRTAPRNAENWRLNGAASPNLAWDYRWATPKRFKVWWFRVVDLKTYAAVGREYDKYTMKATMPGTAWCSGELEIKHAPVRAHGDNLLLHFYPDGHVEADVVDAEGAAPRLDIRKRDQLPVLTDRPCLKEVPNPYFGKKKPVAMY